MTRNIINDGYTKKGRINPEKGLHDGLEFSFRPMVPAQVSVFTKDDYRSKPAKQAVLMMAAAIKEQIVSWSELTDAGGPVPVTTESVSRLPWSLFNRLFNVVAGFDASDEPPQSSSDDEVDEYAQRLIESASGGSVVGELEREADRKN